MTDDPPPADPGPPPDPSYWAPTRADVLVFLIGPNDTLVPAGPVTCDTVAADAGPLHSLTALGAGAAFAVDILPAVVRRAIACGVPILIRSDLADAG